MRSFRRIAIATVGTLAALIFVALNLRSQEFYVDQSRALVSASVTSEVPEASYLRLGSQLRVLSRLPHTVDFVVSDTYNQVLGRLESEYLRGKTLIFPCFDFLRTGEFPVPGMLGIFRPQFLEDYAVRATLAREALRRRERFPVIDATGEIKFNTFDHDLREDLIQPRRTVYLRSSRVLSPLNRWDASPEAPPVAAIPYASVRNQLIFVNSLFGLTYYPVRSTNSSIFQLEPDYFQRGQTMAAVGRYLLFEIVNPSPTVRIALSLTNSVRNDGINALPPAAIVGERRVALPLVGSGSARIISAVVRPLRIAGHSYICLDMGVDGKTFVTRRTGLFGLFGREIIVDPRVLVAFARDISALDERAVRRLVAPTSFSGSTPDFAGQNLLYSGIYEDAWASGNAALHLRSLAGKNVIARGTVPLVLDPNFHTTLTVSVDGKELRTQRLGVGDFELNVPAALRPGGHDVALAFSAVQHLPNGDDRPVGAKLSFVGFE